MGINEKTKQNSDTLPHNNYCLFALQVVTMDFVMQHKSQSYAHKRLSWLASA